LVDVWFGVECVVGRRVVWGGVRKKSGVGRRVVWGGEWCGEE
jgi:hypothetical protein